MKKISRLMLLCMMGLAASCNKEMATPESLEATLEDKVLSSTAVGPFAAGMGPYDVLGHGYDVTGLYADAASAGFKVIDVDRFKQDHAGRVIEERPLSQAYTEEYGENAEEYSKSVSNKVNATSGFKLFGWGISSKFNFENNDSTTFDGKYIYGSYNLVIKQKRYRLNASNELLQSYLTPEFTADLASKTAAQIIKDYGPYVMTDVYTGGKMEMVFQSETRNQNRSQAARIGIKVGANAIFDIEVDGASDVNTSTSSQNFSKKLAYSTIGGDPTKELRGEINLDASASKITITNWQNSVTPENSVLVDFGRDGLVPIYELVADANKRNALKTEFDNYLENGSVENVYKTVPVYSMYAMGGNALDNHFLSVNPSGESANNLINEGIAFHAYTYKRPGTLPVYRYYNSSIVNHLLTIRPSIENLSGYVLEGVAFYAYQSTADANGISITPIYRYWSDFAKDHYFNKTITSINSYKYEGIAFYVPK